MLLAYLLESFYVFHSNKGTSMHIFFLLGSSLIHSSRTSWQCLVAVCKALAVNVQVLMGGDCSGKGND